MIRLIFSILALLATSICSAGTFTITSEIDFGLVTSGSNLQQEITIKNTGNDILQISSIGDINPVSDPFKIVDTGCVNSIIQPGSQCSFMVLFSPESEGVYPDSFNIEIVNQGLSNEVTLLGKGGPAINEPDILVSFNSVDFGIVDVLYSGTATPYKFIQAIQNKGKLDLLISSINVGEKDASEISISGNCLDLVKLTPGSTCTLFIAFSPTTPGEKYAEVSISTNDPDEDPFIIFIRGNATSEDDGVPDLVEDAGPNDGDGDFDDILDSKQSNVVTLIDSFGNYVTYLTDNTFRFSNMSVLQQVEVPADFVIGSGIFDFTVEGLSAGQSIELGVILPAGMKPDAYNMYGPTADNPIKHWFNFDFDGETGAFIFGDVTFTTSSGTKFTRSVLRFIVKDGGRGDSDMTENGVIAVTAAMPITQNSDSGSGSINLLYMIAIFLLVIQTRRDGVIINNHP